MNAGEPDDAEAHAMAAVLSAVVLGRYIVGAAVVIALAFGPNCKDYSSDSGMSDEAQP